jgi:hypothetical protein
MKRVVADLVVATHRQHRLPRRAERRAVQFARGGSARSAASSPRPAAVRCLASSCRTVSPTADSSCAMLASPARRARSRAAREVPGRPDRRRAGRAPVTAA